MYIPSQTSTLHEANSARNGQQATSTRDGISGRIVVSESFPQAWNLSKVPYSTSATRSSEGRMVDGTRGSHSLLSHLSPFVRSHPDHSNRAYSVTIPFLSHNRLKETPPETTAHDGHQQHLQTHISFRTGTSSSPTHSPSYARRKAEVDSTFAAEARAAYFRSSRLELRLEKRRRSDSLVALVTTAASIPPNIPVLRNPS